MHSTDFDQRLNAALSTITTHARHLRPGMAAELLSFGHVARIIGLSSTDPAEFQQCQVIMLGLEQIAADLTALAASMGHVTSQAFQFVTNLPTTPAPPAPRAN